MNATSGFLIVAAAAGVAVAGRIAMKPFGPVRLPGVTSPAKPVGHPIAAAARDSVASRIMARAPFRLDGRPTAVAYDPDRGSQAVPGPPAPPKPVLVLAGIAWGRPATALIDGVPGVEGSRALAVGDTAGGLRVQRIEPGRAVITGHDTTWTLQLKEIP